MKKLASCAALFVALVAVLSATPGFAQTSSKDEAGRVLGLETAWNHAIEGKDVKALDMILASTFIGVEADGSIYNKPDFLASIKAPEYQPSQAVNEQIAIQMYDGAAVVTGIFRVKGMEKGKPYVHRERFTDTWIKIKDTWQCVSSHVTAIPANAK